MVKKTQDAVEVSIEELGDGSVAFSGLEAGEDDDGAEEGASGTGSHATDEPAAGGGEGGTGGTEGGTAEEDLDEDEDHAAALAAAKDDTEREALRERRRVERRTKKQQARERELSMKRENAELRRGYDALQERLNIIERRSNGSELAQLDANIKRANDAAAYYKGMVAEAVTAQNGQLAADATERMNQSQRESENLTRVRQQFTQRQQSQAQAANGGTPAAPNPRVVQLAQGWIGAHAWYNPGARDTDSRLVQTLDEALSEEGWDPATKEYWDELSARVTKYLPHRANRAIIPPSNQRKPGRSPVTGSGREAASGSGKQGSYTLSPERVKALKDAGTWDDPKLRADAVRRYQAYDKQNAAPQR